VRKDLSGDQLRRLDGAKAKAAEIVSSLWRMDVARPATMLDARVGVVYENTAKI
jgi:hypothetical protein